MSISSTTFYFLVLFGGTFHQKITAQEYVIPTHPIQQTNTENGQEFANFRGILLPPSEKSNKLFLGELIYKVQFEWASKKDTKSPFPHMQFSVHTNKFGGFMAKIPAKFIPEKEQIKLTFRHPNKINSIVCLASDFNVNETYGCKLGEQHAVRLKDVNLFELEDELSRFKNRKNNPHFIAWDKFDEVLFKIQKIAEDQSSESKKNVGAFLKIGEDIEKIAKKIDDQTTWTSGKFFDLQQLLKGKKGFCWK